MLTKAANHLRPFIRVPSQPLSSPEHFSANPSLLHHLPQNGGAVHGHTLITQSSSNASTSSSAGSSSGGPGAGAGRNGYSAGNSGYTGHARTFLSFTQASGLDGSSSIGNNTEEEQRKKNSNRRAGLLLKDRYDGGRTTRLIVPPPDGPRRVRKELEGRQGQGVRLSIVDVVDDETPEQQSEARGVLEGKPRRSSIAFPIPQPQLQSQSRRSADVWQVGISRPRQFVRHLSSTRSVVQQIPAPETRVLSQPNRVIMDLAGYSGEPLIRLGGVRRNSVSTMERIPESSSSPLPPPLMDLPQQAKSSAAQQSTAEQSTTEQSTTETEKVIDPDQAFYTAIREATKFHNPSLIRDLIALYRSPREVSPFETNSSERLSSKLSKKYPLPQGYTVETYNACLAALIEIRQPGEAIVQVLDIYNELLERDLVPNTRTYSLVVKALCLREMDIATAVNSRENKVKWDQWSRNLFNVQGGSGSEATTLTDPHQQDVTEGYLREGNLVSAFKLFRAAVLFKQRVPFGQPSNYFALLKASAASPTVDVASTLEVLRHAVRHSVAGHLGLYAYAFEVLGRAKDLEKLSSLWQEFSTAPEQTKSSNWINSGGDQPTASDEFKIITSAKRLAWQHAMVAFVRSGDLAKGIEMMETMSNAESATPSTVEQGLPPRANHLVIGHLIEALAQTGHFDLALEWYERSKAFKSDSQGRHLPVSSILRFGDLLLLDGRVHEAKPIFEQAFNLLESKDSMRLRNLYLALLANSVDASKTVKEIEPLLANVGRLSFPEPLFKHVRLLLEAGKASDIVSTLALLPRVIPKDQTQLEQTPIPYDILSHSDIPFVTRLDLIGQFYRHGIVLENDTVEFIVKAYETERAKVSSIIDMGLNSDRTYRLLSCFSQSINNGIPVPETIFEDLAVLRQTSPEIFEGDSVRAVLRRIHENLESILGRERASKMIHPLSDAIGINRRTYGVSPLKPISEFSLPPTPESLPSPPVESASTPLPPAPRLTISKELSKQVDQHLGKYPSMTAQQAYELVHHKLSANQIPHPETLSRLIVTFSRLNDEPKVRELYQLACTSLECSSSAYQPMLWAHVEDAMLIACCHLGHLEQAGMHRARLVENGMSPSADAYASMIANSKDTTDDALVARELFAESQALGVRPHLYLYNTIISKLSKARKAESALDLFVQMKAAGCRPSSVTYGAVINACCRVGDAESAATLFDEMASMPNFKPRVPPFNTMMQFHLQTRPSREHVLHYYNALRSANVPPSAHTYKLLLDTYSVLPPIDLTQMERVFAELCADRDVPVQGTHWASIITAYGIHGNDLPKALEIFNAIPNHPSTRSGFSYTPEPVVWEAILNVIAQRGTISELESMRQRMIDSGSHPTAYVYNVLISAYASSGDITKSREIFESMGDSFVGVAAPNNHPTLLTSSGQVKPSTVTPLPTHVVYREPSTYEAMIKAELLAGNREAAEMVLKRMEERRYPVAVFMRARAILEEKLDV